MNQTILLNFYLKYLIGFKQFLIFQTIIIKINKFNEIVNQKFIKSKILNYCEWHVYDLI